MSKRTIKWLITGVCLLVIGGILFGGAMAMLQWDFSKLSTSQFETKTHKINESFRSISVDTDTAAISLVPSAEASCLVVCREPQKVTHTVSVKDGALVIQVNDTRKWYEHIGFSFESMTITVYIPAGEYGALTVRSHTGDIEIAKDFRFDSIDIRNHTGRVRDYASATHDVTIQTTTGSIDVEGISVGSLALSVSTGKVTASDVICEGDLSVEVTTGKAALSDVSCRNLISEGSTGDVVLSDVIAEEGLSLKRSTGDIRLNHCDAAEIAIKTSTGDVKGGLLSGKMFFAQSETGRVRVPSSATGGRCEITTDTGDIDIEIIDR